MGPCWTGRLRIARLRDPREVKGERDTEREVSWSAEGRGKS